MRNNHSVKNMTVHLDQSVLDIMKLYPEVNWSGVARTGILEYIEKRQLGDKLIMKRNYLKQNKLVKNPGEDPEPQNEAIV